MELVINFLKLDIQCKLYNKKKKNFFQENTSLWYEYVYTGCYALSFKVEEEYIFVGHNYFVTEYVKENVREPKLTCQYNIDSLKNISR